MKLKVDIEALDWDKVDGMMPAIMQDQASGKVLMMGYMSKDALAKTLEIGKATFFSRTRNVLWTKGETSGHYLDVQSVHVDCDKDTLLFQVNPRGSVCHLGTETCFSDDQGSDLGFLAALANVIEERKATLHEDSKSYTAQLLRDGRARVAQKVGEEGVEVALAQMKEDKDEIVSESADLVYHLMILLAQNDLSLGDVVQKLESRHQPKH